MLYLEEDLHRFLERFEHLSLDNLLQTNSKSKLLDDTNNNHQEIICPFLTSPKTREVTNAKNIILISPDAEIARIYMEIGKEMIYKKAHGEKIVMIKPYEFLFMQTFVSLQLPDRKLPSRARLYLHAGERNESNGISVKYRGKNRTDILYRFPIDLFTTEQHTEED